jgi:putative membrane protein
MKGLDEWAGPCAATHRGLQSGGSAGCATERAHELGFEEINGGAIGGVSHEIIGVAIRSMSLLVCVLCAPAFSQTAVPSTEEFVTDIAISDMMEIQAAKLALTKEPDGDTKPFAERMMKDHEHTSMELKGLVDSGKVNVTLPTALDSQHQRELDELKAKSGKEFDRGYGPMQVKAHERAIQLFESYARGGDNPDLKAWAARTLPHLQQHLEMAKRLI